MNQEKLDLTRLFALAEILQHTEFREWCGSVRACADRIAALPPQDAAAVRAAALEEAAQLSETWFNRHRPKQPDKSRFNIYDIEHWAKSATRLVAEDIRALASAPPAAEIERTKGET